MDTGEFSTIFLVLSVLLAGCSVGGLSPGADSTRTATSTSTPTPSSNDVVADENETPTDSEQQVTETDQSDTDTDGDGILDEREESLGTDPTAADTDGDGLNDTVELNQYGTDPTAADTDEDGLDDGEEVRDYGTNPTEADTDADGLSDGEEVRTYGTIPTDSDTDNDRLLDGAEVDNETAGGAKLPDADPLQVDLYVQFNRADNVDEPSDSLYSSIKSHWAEMDVENPDGSTGINLHIRKDGTINESIAFSRHSGELSQLKQKYYTTELGSRAGIYHQVLFVEFVYDDVGRLSGYGELPGKFNVADASSRVAAIVITHELLHNVMGRLEVENTCEDDPEHYCDGGFLDSSSGPDDDYLPDQLAEYIEENGFR